MSTTARVVLAMLQALVSIVLIPLAFVFFLFSIVLVVPLILWLWYLAVQVLVNRQATVTIARRLRRTHWPLLLLEGLLIVYGFLALEGARQSAEAGGGLLGAFGIIPIGMGVLAGTGSIATLALCWYLRDER